MERGPSRRRHHVGRLDKGRRRCWRFCRLRNARGPDSNHGQRRESHRRVISRQQERNDRRHDHGRRRRRQRARCVDAARYSGCWGPCGDGLGFNMIAGSILVFGSCGDRPGAGMRRGTIGLFGTPPPALLPTFRPPAVFGPLFLRLALSRVRRTRASAADRGLLGKRAVTLTRRSGCAGQRRDLDRRAD